MKIISLLIIILIQSFITLSQNTTSSYKPNKKGEIYAYWGWNRGWYSKSDITFKGNDFDFELSDVIAKDRQSEFDLNLYANPANISIPQYNFRVGYFIHDNYNISIGADHMKYVVQQEQSVKITGEIENSGTVYDGVYSDDYVKIVADFLLLEHTDGLNYLNVEFRRFNELITMNKVSLNITEGIGTGMLIPRTSSTLLSKQNHDEFHLAGYGLSGVVAVNITFFKNFFLQSEIKGGYINMPDIEITHSYNERAKQSFFFTQWNVVFGASFNLIKNK